MNERPSRAIQWVLVLIFALVLPLPGHAQAYRCVDPDGQISFTDRPCTEGQESTVLEAPGAIKVSPRDKRPSHALSVDGTIRLYGNLFEVGDVSARWDPVRETIKVTVYPFVLTPQESMDLFEGRSLPKDLSRISKGVTLTRYLGLDVVFGGNPVTKNRDTMTFFRIVDLSGKMPITSNMSPKYALPFLKTLRVTPQDGRLYLTMNLEGRHNQILFDTRFQVEVIR